MRCGWTRCRGVRWGCLRALSPSALLQSSHCSAVNPPASPFPAPSAVSIPASPWVFVAGPHEPLSVDAESLSDMVGGSFCWFFWRNDIIFSSMTPLKSRWNAVEIALFPTPPTRSKQWMYCSNVPGKSKKIRSFTPGQLTPLPRSFNVETRRRACPCLKANIACSRCSWVISPCVFSHARPSWRLMIAHMKSTDFFLCARIKVFPVRGCVKCTSAMNFIFCWSSRIPGITPSPNLTNLCSTFV